jgi:hypothetical protein
MSDHNDIYSIVERLRILEEGLDKNQKSVNQLGATFKPKTVAVLTAKTDPKNPMAGKLVGSDESVDTDEEPLDEAVATEDVLDRVKKSFTEFIKQAEEEINDSDIKEKKHEDTDLKSKQRQDRTLVSKQSAVAEQDIAPGPVSAAPVKSLSLMDGIICEIHGNEQDGFEVRRGQRSLPTRFKNLDQAEMAIKMFDRKRQARDESADYIEER